MLHKSFEFSSNVEQTYRVSLKKGTLAIFVLFLSQKTYFTFSYVFCDQSFKPILSGQLKYIHSESKLS